MSARRNAAVVEAYRLSLIDGVKDLIEALSDKERFARQVNMYWQDGDDVFDTLERLTQSKPMQMLSYWRVVTNAAMMKAKSVEVAIRKNENRKGMKTNAK